jgi:cyclopropane fatty-acyl-phospholipid synthase-like methyltransferase
LSWWESFFDADYLRIWGSFHPPEQSQREADGLGALLGLGEGSRVLDAPCGYGRLSRLLALRGAAVLGENSRPIASAISPPWDKAAKRTTWRF